MESRALEWWRRVGRGMATRRAGTPAVRAGELRSIHQLLTAVVQRKHGLLLHLDLRPLARGRAAGKLTQEFPPCADEALELVLEALAGQAAEARLRVWYTVSASRRNKVLLSARQAGLGRRLRKSATFRRAHQLLARHDGGLQLLCGDDQESVVISCDLGPEAAASAPDLPAVLARTGTG